ncbi:hypothetical protein B0J13DRAFT_542439, partial [Dactylonectria estremocensis]
MLSGLCLCNGVSLMSSLASSTRANEAYVLFSSHTLYFVVAAASPMGSCEAWTLDTGHWTLDALGHPWPKHPAASPALWPFWRPGHSGSCQFSASAVGDPEIFL